MVVASARILFLPHHGATSRPVRADEAGTKFRAVIEHAEERLLPALELREGMAPALLGDPAATEKIARTLEQLRDFVEGLEVQQSTIEFIEFPGMFG